MRRRDGEGKGNYTAEGTGWQPSSEGEATGIARGEGLESPDMSIEEMLELPPVDMDAVERWLMDQVRNGGTVAVKMQAAKVLSDRRKQLTVDGAITIVQVPVLFDEAIAAAADADGLVDASHWDNLPSDDRDEGDVVDVAEVVVEDDAAG